MSCISARATFWSCHEEVLQTITGTLPLLAKLSPPSCWQIMVNKHALCTVLVPLQLSLPLPVHISVFDSLPCDLRLFNQTVKWLQRLAKQIPTLHLKGDRKEREDDGSTRGLYRAAGLVGDASGLGMCAQVCSRLCMKKGKVSKDRACL